MSTETHKVPQLSIIIPAYNEEESLPILLQQLDIVLKTYSYCAEIILINDGSTDATAEVLDTLSKQSHRFTVHVIHFRHNHGKAEALMAGFAIATGDIIITMDADLQDDPDEIPTLLNALNSENYDVISGWKYPRKDPLEKRAFSFVFNRVTTLFTGVKLHDMNCGFKAYRAEVIKELHLYGDLHRYIPILAHQAGYKVGEVKVRHHPRRFGISKYGFKRIPKGFLDLFTVLFLTKYLKRPLHVFGTIGTTVTFIGFLIGIYLAFVWFIEGGVGFRPLLMLSVLMIILGVQFFSIGLLGELMIAMISRLERRLIEEKTPRENTPQANEVEP